MKWCTCQALGGQQYLWIVFRVPRMQGDRLEVQPAIKVDGGNDVSFGACEISLLTFTRTWQTGSYILQGRNNSADSLSRAGCGSRRRGCHPVAVGLDCLTPIRTLPLTIHLLGLGGGGSEIASATWEGERAGRDEGLRLRRVLRMSLDRVHLGGIVLYDLRLSCACLIVEAMREDFVRSISDE
jgi:hypothetical protein